MKIWPFGNKLETRDDSYSDVLIAALVSRAQGKSLAVPSATSALEAVRGAYRTGLCLCGSHGAGLADQGLDAAMFGTGRPLANPAW